jgi:SAM-dependent methyltransferase
MLDAAAIIPPMSGDPYDTFARIYDAWQAGYPRPFARAVLPFYERELMRRRVPERSLVDLACGTGAFLGIWGRRHADWSLFGTDQSRGMLRVARQSLSRAGVTAQLLRQPLQELAMPRPVGAAVCIFDSVNHLTRLRDLRRFARMVARSLLPGGLFVFDVNDELAFPRLFSGNWTVETKSLYISITASCRADGLRGELRFTVFEHHGRRWKRTNFAIAERNWRRQELMETLRAAGFTILRTRRIEPYSSEDTEAPRNLWSCRRMPDPHDGTGRTLDS